MRPLDASPSVASGGGNRREGRVPHARIASKRLADPAKYAEVLLPRAWRKACAAGSAARGVEDIVLVDGTCATCKFPSNVPGIDTVASANELMAAQGSDVCVRRASAFPDEVLLEDKRTLLGESRRGFFTSARTRAKDAAGKTAEVMVFKNDNAAPSLRERLRMSDAGTLPQFNPQRRMLVLDAMDRLGAPTVPEIDTRLFGSVSIDTQACSSCNMCTVFCPTGALRKSELVPAEGEGSFLEFSAADCVQCNLCADACLKSCLTVNWTVSTEELFDFEPRLIHLPNPPARPGILSSLRR
ncbi:MAG: 4Fe-4S binding protein [Eggerthella lenta]